MSDRQLRKMCEDYIAEDSLGGGLAVLFGAALAAWLLLWWVLT